MDFTLPYLSFSEEAALKIRALYEKNQYKLFKMGSFEEYGLYLQNKNFLSGEDIITFTASDGRLMALKPDVTLSIVKNTPDGETRKLYYNESVYRRSRQTGEYREISQMGIEFIGGEDANAEVEVLKMAAKTLSMIGSYALDLSHMEFIEAVLEPFGERENARQQAYSALKNKSPHEMENAAKAAGIKNGFVAKLLELVSLNGAFEETIERAYSIAEDIPGAKRPLDELSALYKELSKTGEKSNIRLDFSIVNDVNYYNGLIFQGFIQNLPYPVLNGGRYDNLLRRFAKSQGAVGFALYLDEIEKLNNQNSCDAAAAAANDWGYLNIALPKGRLGDKVYALFSKAGLSCDDILEESRKLVFEDEANRVRYFLVKPSDVDIYVEHGAADIGVVGKDVLLESDADVLELFDLHIGKCRLAVAAMNDFAENPAQPLKVATKYPVVARGYYASQSRDVEIIKLHGSIELAPILGLSDVIVDIVETGSTLKENNLSVIGEICTSSARLIANRSSWRFKGARIEKLVERLGEVL